jgi:hypothetical protein
MLRLSDRWRSWFTLHTGLRGNFLRTLGLFSLIPHRVLFPWLLSLSCGGLCVTGLIWCTKEATLATRCLALFLRLLNNTLSARFRLKYATDIVILLLSGVTFIEEISESIRNILNLTLARGVLLHILQEWLIDSFLSRRVKLSETARKWLIPQLILLLTRRWLSRNRHLINSGLLGSANRHHLITCLLLDLNK